MLFISLSVCLIGELVRVGAVVIINQSRPNWIDLLFISDFTLVFWPSEWLSKQQPLSPIAVDPFFMLTCRFGENLSFWEGKYAYRCFISYLNGTTAICWIKLIAVYWGLRQ